MGTSRSFAARKGCCSAKLERCLMSRRSRRSTSESWVRSGGMWLSRSRRCVGCFRIRCHWRIGREIAQRWGGARKSVGRGALRDLFVRNVACVNVRWLLIAPPVRRQSKRTSCQLGGKTYDAAMRSRFVPVRDDRAPWTSIVSAASPGIYLRCDSAFSGVRTDAPTI